MADRLIWSGDGTPRCALFGDIFCNTQRPWSEKKHVFWAANQLDHQLNSDQPVTIGELGFGFGLNFLLVLDAITRQKPKCPWHFYSLDQFPLNGSDLARVHNWLQSLNDPCAPPDPVLSTFLDHYPESIDRDWTWSSPDGDLILHFLCGDVQDRLKDFPMVSCWFLDGFSPQLNQAMWTSNLYKQIANRSLAHARISTYSAAGDVRRGLENVGFQCQKIKGFGHKREMLTATFKPSIIA